MHLDPPGCVVRVKTTLLLDHRYVVRQQYVSNRPGADT
jgi:hypothetical protein